MKHLFIENSFKLINKHKKLDHYNQVKIKYGLEVMYHFITKLIVVIIISLLLHILLENLVFFLFYGLLRMFSYGVHAKTNIGCWVISLSTYIFTGLVIKYMDITNLFPLLILMSLLIIYYSPADTSSKPIISKDLRRKLKIIVTLILAIYILMYLIIKISLFKDAIILSVLLQLIMVNPVTYLMFKRTYNNYMNYCKNKWLIDHLL